MRPTTLPDPTSDAPCGIFASFPQSGSGAAPAAGAGEAHSAARGANGPHREGRRGKEGGGANNLHLRESNHRITRLSRRPPQAGSRPPCGTDVRSRGFVADRCRRALREYPGRHSTGAPCRRPRLHPGVCISDFSRFPRRRETSSGNREGGEAPPAPKARRHGAPDGGGLHGPKGPQRREGEDVIVGHISISLPTETGCVSGAAERRAERDSKRAERKIALHRTDFCVPPQGAEAADRRRRRDRPESRAGALRRSGAAPNGRHRRRGDIGLPGKRPDGEQRLRRNRMRSAFRTQCAEERKTSETRRTLPEKAGASSDLARDAPGQKGYREAQNVSGDTGRDPRLARNAPRNGNIRNTPNASGEGGRVFGPRTRCAGTKRLPGSAERIRRYRMRPAFRTQCAEKRKHPKRDEGFRRRWARLRTSHAMCRDAKATEKRRTYPAIPDAIRISHANRREAETSETRRTLTEKAGPETDAAGAPPRREAGRFQPFGKKRSEEAAFVFFGENPYICTIFNQDQ